MYAVTVAGCCRERGLLAMFTSSDYVPHSRLCEQAFTSRLGLNTNLQYTVRLSVFPDLLMLHSKTLSLSVKRPW